MTRTPRFSRRRVGIIAARTVGTSIAIVAASAASAQAHEGQDAPSEQPDEISAPAPADTPGTDAVHHEEQSAPAEEAPADQQADEPQAEQHQERREDTVAAPAEQPEHHDGADESRREEPAEPRHGEQHTEQAQEPEPHDRPTEEAAASPEDRRPEHTHTEAPEARDHTDESTPEPSTPQPEESSRQDTADAGSRAKESGTTAEQRPDTGPKDAVAAEDTPTTEERTPPAPVEDGRPDSTQGSDRTTDVIGSAPTPTHGPDAQQDQDHREQAAREQAERERIECDRTERARAEREQTQRDQAQRDQAVTEARQEPTAVAARPEQTTTDRREQSPTERSSSAHEIPGHVPAPENTRPQEATPTPADTATTPAAAAPTTPSDTVEHDHASDSGTEDDQAPTGEDGQQAEPPHDHGDRHHSTDGRTPGPDETTDEQSPGEPDGETPDTSVTTDLDASVVNDGDEVQAAEVSLTVASPRPLPPTPEWWTALFTPSTPDEAPRDASPAEQDQADSRPSDDASHPDEESAEPGDGREPDHAPSTRGAAALESSPADRGASSESPSEPTAPRDEQDERPEAPRPAPGDEKRTRAAGSTDDTPATVAAREEASPSEEPDEEPRDTAPAKTSRPETAAAPRATQTPRTDEDESPSSSTPKTDEAEAAETDSAEEAPRPRRQETPTPTAHTTTPAPEHSPTTTPSASDNPVPSAPATTSATAPAPVPTPTDRPTRPFTPTPPLPTPASTHPTWSSTRDVPGLHTPRPSDHVPAPLPQRDYVPVPSAAAPSAPTTRPAPPSTPSTPAAREWPSGLMANDARALEGERGRAADVLVVEVDGRSWTSLTSLESLHTVRTSPARVVVRTPMLPSGGFGLQACAAGEFRAQWTTFGRRLTEMKNPPIVDLGAAMNDAGHPWSVDPSAYAACYAEVARTVKAVAPQVAFQWTPMIGSRPGMPGDAVLAAWPGVEAVDVIGVEAVADGRPWSEQVNGAYGLNHWAAFADRHGKRIAVARWGVHAGAAQDRAVNPAYIRNMRDWVARVAAKESLAYEVYTEPVNAPKEIAAAYRALF